jgi:Organic solute transporter Ostalpha
MILRSTSLLAPSSTLTWADINIGLPIMIICILMVPFSLFFYYAYSVKPHLINKSSYPVEHGKYEPITPLQYEGGLFNLKMWFSLLSIPDMIRGISPREVHPFINGRAYYQKGEELQNANNRLQYARN